MPAQLELSMKYLPNGFLAVFTAGSILMALEQPASAQVSIRMGMGARMLQAGSGTTAHIGNTGLMTFDASFGFPFAGLFILELAATPMYKIKARQFAFAIKPGFRLRPSKFFYLRGYLYIPLYPSPSEKDLAFQGAPGISFAILKSSLQIFVELPLGINFRPQFLMALMVGVEIRF